MNDQPAPAQALEMLANIQAAYKALPHLPTGILNFAVFIDEQQMTFLTWTNINSAINQHVIQQLHNQLAAQQNTIQQQQGQLQALGNIQIPQPVINVAAPAAPAHQAQAPKVPKPQSFKGDRASAKAFIQSLDIYFSMGPLEFLKLQAKIKCTLLLCED